MTTHGPPQPLTPEEYDRRLEKMIAGDNSQKYQKKVKVRKESKKTRMQFELLKSEITIIKDRLSVLEKGPHTRQIIEEPMNPELKRRTIALINLLNKQDGEDSES